MSCVGIALKHSEECEAIYQQIVETWDRPDCQALLKDSITLPIAEVREWEKAVADNGAYDPGFDVWTLLHEPDARHPMTTIPVVR